VWLNYERGGVLQSRTRTFYFKLRTEGTRKGGSRGERRTGREESELRTTPKRKVPQKLGRKVKENVLSSSIKNSLLLQSSEGDDLL